MSAEHQLEKFRKQWRKELSGKNETLPLEKRKSTSRRVDQCNNRANSETESRMVHEPANVCNYIPFRIVGNLLDEHGDENQSKVTVLDTKTRHSLEDSDERKLKKFKLTTMRDIFSERKRGEIPSERLLDKLISDIDEITAIPFFDISLPREVAVNIFQYLSMRDLCSSAQVSKSWSSLAEDELLWCRLCHKLGHEKIYTTHEKTNWKQIVRHNVERQRTLVSNWKNRTGKLQPLEHVKGKILTSVHSQGDAVVAGYTSGEVKLWNLSDSDCCIFQPSSTSLVLDPQSDGLHENIVNRVCTADDITVAAYSQGNVDIWSLEFGTKPLQTFTPKTGNQYSPNISLSNDGTTIAASYGSFIDVLHRSRHEEEFSVVKHMDCENTIYHMMLYNANCDIPSVIFSKAFSVHLYQPQPLESKQSDNGINHVTEIHNLIGAPVDVVDFKTDQPVLGVALGSYGELTEGYKVKMYDMNTTKLLQTLEGNTWMITCMNMRDSPQHHLVTGSGDRKVRVYDIRTSHPEQTLIGHSFKVSCVQMDDWKVVSGAEDGFLCVWDRRMAAKLWELHNRHPVRYSCFNDKTLIVANISSNKFPVTDDYDNMTHRRYRGTLNVYNFLEDLTTKDVPEICLSTYDQPDASKYNISLAVPYDTLTF